jgi:ankyrin repeat protein
MNVKDSHLSAALCKAAWAGRTEAVKLLLERGAGTPAQEDGDWTPMRGAVAGGDKEMQELLRAHGAASFEVVGQLPKPAAFQNAQALSKPT